MFSDFPAAVAFVNRLVPDAEAADHHPDIIINYRRVTLLYSTHSEGGSRRRTSTAPPWPIARLADGREMRLDLKKNYSSREVASITGLSARQLQWWDARKLMKPSIASHRTEAGGFTERRYSPVDLFELAVLADLRRSGLSVGKMRLLLDTLRRRFGVRLFDAIGGGGAITLLTDGKEIYARTESGQFFNLLRAPSQPLLVVGNEGTLKELKLRMRSKSRARRRSPPLAQLADRKDLFEIVGGARDDVDADELAHAPRRGGARVGGGFHRGDIAAHDGGDEARIDFLPAHEHDVRRLHHGVGGFDHADESACFHEAERFAELGLGRGRWSSGDQRSLWVGSCYHASLRSALSRFRLSVWPSASEKFSARARSCSSSGGVVLHAVLERRHDRGQIAAGRQTLDAERAVLIGPSRSAT